MVGYRMEQDSIGSRKVQEQAYYGVQSLRARDNFQITGLHSHPAMIQSVALVKKAAAITNCEIGLLEKKKAEAIVQACDEIAKGAYRQDFIVDPIQGGAGTSFHMNANEVIANRAIEILGGKKGDYTVVHPNDDVNLGQSTNDVFPTVGKLAVLKQLSGLMDELNHLKDTLGEKARQFNHIIKIARTQLQDAVPIRLGQEFYAYSVAVERDLRRLKKSMEELYILNMGGTAVGTGINADQEYIRRIVPNISDVTGIQFVQAYDLIDATQNLDAFVAVSAAIKACAVTASKIANDLRLLSSGPRTGLGEINLPPMQNGSSIMPGKINPVIPEVVNQVAFLVIGNDVAITLAAESGQLELNAFEPILFFCLMQSIDTLHSAIHTFVDNCVGGITANEDQCRLYVENSVGMITAISPMIGYQRAAYVAEEAIRCGKPLREILKREHLLDTVDLDAMLNPMAMTEPSKISKLVKTEGGM